jgi:hypothetical protein
MRHGIRRGDHAFGVSAHESTGGGLDFTKAMLTRRGPQAPARRFQGAVFAGVSAADLDALAELLHHMTPAGQRPTTKDNAHDIDG